MCVGCVFLKQAWDMGPWKDLEVTLVETPSGGDMEPQVATSYSQLGLPVEGEGHQYMHNTFNTKFDLLTIYAEIKLEQIEGLANQ